MSIRKEELWPTNGQTIPAVVARTRWCHLPYNYIYNGPAPHYVMYALEVYAVGFSVAKWHRQMHSDAWAIMQMRQLAASPSHTINDLLHGVCWMPFVFEWSPGSNWYHHGNTKAQKTPSCSRGSAQSGDLHVEWGEKWQCCLICWVSTPWKCPSSSTPSFPYSSFSPFPFSNLPLSLPPSPSLRHSLSPVHPVKGLPLAWCHLPQWCGVPGDPGAWWDKRMAR